MPTITESTWTADSSLCAQKIVTVDGATLRARIRRNIYDRQSRATVDTFDGTLWHTIYTCPITDLNIAAWGVAGAADGWRDVIVDDCDTLLAIGHTLTAPPAARQNPEGYIVAITTPGRAVTFAGPFPTSAEAQTWAANRGLATFTVVALNDPSAPDADLLHPPLLGDRIFPCVPYYPATAAAGLGVMSGILEVLNDREFASREINPTAEQVTAWYDAVIAKAIDVLEFDIAYRPETAGLTADDIVDGPLL